MDSRLARRQRPARPSRVGRRVGASTPATPPPFLGQFSMYREICASDPNWTPPADGALLTTVRDNGTVAADYTASGDNATVAPHYVADLVGGRPGFDFRASSNSVGGKLESSEPGAAPVSAIRTVTIVGRIDAEYSGYAYFCDAIGTGSSATQRRIVGSGANAASTFGMYSNSGSFVNAGAVDANLYIWVAVFGGNDHRLYRDGALIGTDATSTVTTSRNTVIGRSRDTLGCLDGAIGYYGEFDGDQTAEDGYAAWLALLADFYGKTLV